MAKTLEMPKLSPTMEEGQLATWHKKEGDTVEVDELLAEVETDKATMEFRSFDKGVLLKILAPAGSTVKLGDPVAIIGEAGEKVDDSAAKPAEAKAAEAPKKDEPEAPKKDQPEAKAEAEAPKKEEQLRPPPMPPKKDQPAPVGHTDDERVKASPYVRKLARERGLDLHGVDGSGPAGRVVAKDLENVQAPKANAPASPSGGKRAEPTKRPLSPMRKTIARRLTESKQTVPHFYLTIDVDAGALVALRETIVHDVPEGEDAPKISLNDLLVKACGLALRKVPECNAQFTPDALLIFDRVDISVAVAVPDGLVTPVVRDADKKSVADIAREIRGLAGRAKTKKLTPEEMTDGTFSISNLGMFGIDEFSAVINPPEGAILAVGRVRDEPVVKDGAVVPGKRLALTLSCDHRVIDGAVGARFLAALRQLLEHPTRILVGG